MERPKGCEIWDLKLAARHPEDLSAEERAALNEHITSCLTCTVTLREYLTISARIRTLPPVNPIPPVPARTPWRYARSGNTSQKSFFQKIGGATNGLKVAATAVLAACIVIVLVGLFHGFYLLTGNQSGNYHNTQVTTNRNSQTSQQTAQYPSKGFTNICPLSPVGSNTHCQANYRGTFQSEAASYPSTMLLSIKQSQQKISGICSLLLPMTVKVPFLGTVNLSGDIEFTLTISSINVTYQFTGSVNTDGTIEGIYTSSDHQKGTWSISLLS